MVQPRTVLRVIDNTGVQRVRCIQVLTGPRAMGTVGHTIVCSVLGTDRSNKRINRGDVVRALIVRAKNERPRKDGSWLYPSDAACILVNTQGNPLGNRINEVVSRHLLKKRDNLKVLSLARFSA